MSVHKKLMEARIKLQNTKLQKTGQNKFAGYTYFELGDFLPTVQQIFAELGLCGTITFTERAELKIVDVDSPEQAIYFVCPIASASLKGCHDVQNLGASMTYIRRYLWVNALEIVEHDALDATTGQGTHKPAQNNSYKPEGEELVFIESVYDRVISNKHDPEFASIYLFHEAKLDSDQMAWVWNKLGETKIQWMGKEYKYRGVLKGLNDQRKIKESEANKPLEERE